MRKALVLLAVTVMFINSTAYAEVRKSYYESGQLRKETNYKDDKREGLSKYYYESGQLRLEINYKDGKAEGISKSYYESGQLKKETNYKDGNPEGISNTYYASGQLQKEAYFMNGIMISKKEYDEEGNLESDQAYPTE
jgi:antitoxin component YwqK of YwqJK toxin-antitoxin module